MAVLAWGWAQPPAGNFAAHREISVTLIGAQSGPTPTASAPQAKLSAQPDKPHPAPMQTEKPIATEANSPPPQSGAPVQMIAASTTAEEPLSDVESNSRATYLHTPRPAYPLAARRHGLQGKVVLNVEVLTEGRCGQVLVHQSSGFDLLDNAALQAMKDWRFAPARQAGHVVTRWFLIPIQFSLTDNEI
jgi:periplasmic protein TonB